MSEVDRPRALDRARRWIGGGVAVAAVGYGAYAVWHGIDATGAALAGFAWVLAIPILLLTLVNYALRYVKWAYLLRRVGIAIPHRTNVWIFLTGFPMALSPGRAGELVKPWLVQQATGASLLRSVPVLVSERATDGIAVVALAAIGVSTYYADGVQLVVTTCVVVGALLVALSIEPLALGVVAGIARLPLVGRFAGRLEEMYRALRVCLAPLPLAWTVALSLVAWFAECVGMWLVLVGLGLDVSVDLATFLYAFATFFGAPSPGGLGVADAALAEGTRMLVPASTGGQALAAALLIRVATLWFGVILGAVALLRIDPVLADARRHETAESA